MKPRKRDNMRFEVDERDKTPVYSQITENINFISRLLLFESNFRACFYHDVLKPMGMTTDDLLLLGICYEFRKPSGFIVISQLRRRYFMCLHYSMNTDKMETILSRGFATIEQDKFVYITPKGIDIVLRWNEFVLFKLEKHRKIFFNE